MILRRAGERRFSDAGEWGAVWSDAREALGKPGALTP